jgi:hypothetical protein
VALGCVHILALGFLPWVAIGVRFQHPVCWVCEGVLVAQPCLLGMWLGLGSTARSKRVAGALLGLLGCAAIFAFIQWSVQGRGGGFVALFGLMSIVTLVLAIGPAAVCCALRKWRSQLLLIETGGSSCVTDGLQFSLRHMLTFVTIVAILLSIGRSARTFLGEYNTSLEIVQTLTFMGLLILCFTSVTLGTIWATLGFGSPHVRLVVVIILAFLVGVLFSYSAGNSIEDFWRMPVEMVGAATFAIGSLLLVRRAGYRMVVQAGT